MEFLTRHSITPPSRAAWKLRAPKPRTVRTAKGRRELGSRVSSASSSSSSEKLPISIFGSDEPEEASLVERSADLASLEEEGVPSGGRSVDTAAQVLRERDGIVMIRGLSCEASIGTRLLFKNGQQGALLWRYTSDVCFALVADADSPMPNDTVCCVRSRASSRVETLSLEFLSLPDWQCVKEETDGLGRYEQFEIMMGDRFKGKVISDVLSTLVDCDQGSGMIPLLNKELDMASRQCIYQPLSMQHKGIDILTPIGRGQCILLISEDDRELTALADHILAAQDTSSVLCVYACIGKSEEELNEIESQFQDSKLLENCVFVKASRKASLAERFAAMCAALSFGESVRDVGRDAVVVINTLQPLSEVWNAMQKSYADHGPTSNREEVKQGEDLEEINGTFMASKTAERRRFFSSVLQRASKASEALGGGSMTVVPVVNGFPASGNQQQELQTKLDAIERDPKLSDTLKAKLREKLRPSTVEDSSILSNPASIPTFIVEEFMSIADGQIVMKNVTEDGMSIDPLLSVSRLGARVYPAALEELAANLRLQLAQSADAMQFASSSDNPASEIWNLKIEVMKEALVQKSGLLSPLSHQVIVLLALRTEKAQKMSAKDIKEYLTHVMELFETEHSDILQQIDTSQCLEQKLLEDILQIVNERM